MKLSDANILTGIPFSLLLPKVSLNLDLYDTKLLLGMPDQIPVTKQLFNIMQVIFNQI